MINKNKITELASKGLEPGMFLVDVNVSKSNVINVYIDSMEGITIAQCVALSREIESSLDRDVEDFELQVSSAGLGQPFKVIGQYHKNLGKEVEVIANNGEKTKGILKEVAENGIKINSAKKIKVEGKKKKQVVEEEINFNFSDIKSVKNIISF